MQAIYILEYEAGRLRRALVNMQGIEYLEKMIQDQLNNVEWAITVLNEQKGLSANTTDFGKVK